MDFMHVRSPKRRNPSTLYPSQTYCPDSLLGSPRKRRDQRPIINSQINVVDCFAQVAPYYPTQAMVPNNYGTLMCNEQQINSNNSKKKMMGNLYIDVNCKAGVRDTETTQAALTPREESIVQAFGDMKSICVTDVTNGNADVKDIANSLSVGHMLVPSTSPRAQRTPAAGGKWLLEEDDELRQLVNKHGAKNWKLIAEKLSGGRRTDVQCLHRWNKVLKPGLIKGPWTAEEDDVVRNMVMYHGIGKIKWSEIAIKLPGRIGKQCRERWLNHLDPDIKKGCWTTEEDAVVFQAPAHIGKRWSQIAQLLPGRTENAVKNRYNSSARKKWINSHNSCQTLDEAKFKAISIKPCMTGTPQHFQKFNNSDLQQGVQTSTDSALSAFENFHTSQHSVMSTIFPCVTDAEKASSTFSSGFDNCKEDFGDCNGDSKHMISTPTSVENSSENCNNLLKDIDVEWLGKLDNELGSDIDIQSSLDIPGLDNNDLDFQKSFDCIEQSYKQADEDFFAPKL